MNMMTVFVLVGLIMTVLSLFQGITSMAHGGEADQTRSHVLMFRRVAWQALTLLCLVLALLSQAK
jgi:hypothetical protein